MRTPFRRWSIIAVALLALLSTGCSGGRGRSGAGEDLGLASGDMIVQFDGAAKLHLGGTLSMPATASKGPVAGVLIIPTVARNDRNGYIDVVPGDPVYQDLGRAVTGAGMAAFRYDRRGMGVSRLEPGQQASFDDMVTDARDALSFLAQRSGIDPGALAVVGHDVGGVIAMKLVATDPRIRSVVLLSTPGRPLVDVMADGFLASNGPESAAAFRSAIATLLAAGSLPDRASMPPELQSVLPGGEDALLKTMYSLDPMAEAAGVKAPALVVTGTQSTLVGATDAARLTAVLPSAEALSADTTATLQLITPALAQAFDPNDHRAHGGGRPPDTATRDQGAVDRIAAFLKSKVGGPRQ